MWGPPEHSPGLLDVDDAASDVVDVTSVDVVDIDRNAERLTDPQGQTIHGRLDAGPDIEDIAFGAGWMAASRVASTASSMYV